jgi:hypothetical protein
VIVQKSGEGRKSTYEVNSNVRIAETTGKHLLYLEVIFPDDISPENYLENLENFEVREVAVKRNEFN